MVRDDAERRHGLLLRSVPQRGSGGIDQLTEKIGFEDALDALEDAGHALQPQAGDEQLVLLQPELLRDQVPGEFDRTLLEVVAEGEIAEHLEKSEMARGVADIVEVVVLAAGPDAFLRGGGALIGALLDTGEDVLE